MHCERKKARQYILKFDFHKKKRCILRMKKLDASDLKFFAKLAAVPITIAAMITMNFTFNDAAKGQAWLEDNQYTNVTGGDYKLLSTCGNGVVSRKYKATPPKSDQSKDVIVCLSPFGAYKAPLIN